MKNTCAMAAACEAWRESGLSQAIIVTAGSIAKPFHLWTRRDQGEPSMDRDTSLELISVSVRQSGSR